MTSQREHNFCKFPMEQLTFTFHALYNVPQEILLLDPQQELIEVVILPVVSYDYNEAPLTRIPLGEHVMRFFLASIVFKGGRLIMDVDKNNEFDTREMCEEQSGVLFDKFAQWLSPLPNTTTESEKAKTKRKKRCKEEEEGNNKTGDDSIVHMNCDISCATNDDVCKNKNKNGNTLLLQWPCPPGLRAHIDVTVGIRLRKKGRTAPRWITSRPDHCDSANSVAQFSVAVDEVYKKKHITRIVGLSVGGAIFSFAVSPTDVRERIVNRLLDNKKQCCAASRKSIVEDVDIVNMLNDGFSEQEIYRHMLLLVDPNHFRRRLESTLMLYNSNGEDGKNAELWQCDVLLEEYALREEELMRRVAMEVGPEYQSVSLRHRLRAFCEKHSISEQRVVNCLHSAIGKRIYKTFITEPEEIFDILKKEFGEEPLPTSYLFSVQAYQPDKRAFFYDALCDGKKNENDCNAAVLLRNSRPPFTISPFEEPLHVENSISRPGEVETLREKYAAEFAQIVPFITNALQMVVEKNQTLYSNKSFNGIFAVFQHQNGEAQPALREIVERTAQHTFISPSSMLGAIIYLDRLSLRYPELVILEANIFRLFVTSIRVASKVLELRTVNNSYFAEVFDLDMKSMNNLEEAFVKLLQFDLFLSSVEFREYACALQALNAHKQRGLVATKISTY